MSRSAVLVLVLTIGTFLPQLALGQGSVQLAATGPQPHFVAAWAPKSERAAEESPVLATRVSLELTSVTLDEALKTLTREGKLQVLYSTALLSEDKRVTIHARDVAVLTALTEILFRSGLDILVDRTGTLAIVRCSHDASPPRESGDTGRVVGRVTDAGTGQPLVGATVIVETLSLEATTDSEGRFRISYVAPGNYTLRVRYIGYDAVTRIVTVKPATELQVIFELKRSIQLLDDVVTVTPGGMQSQIRSLPSPVTIVTATDIEKRRPQTLMDVVRQSVPAAVVFSVPSRPDQTSFGMRGASSLSGLGSMKIFIDGVETASFGSSPVDPASIDRIEVIRGPQAATLYGSDAAAGVVQIFTKRGDPSLQRPQVDGQASLGIAQTSYDGFQAVLRQRYAASVRGGGDDIGYNFGGGYTRLADWLPAGEPSRQSSPNVYGGIRYSQGIVRADLHGRYYRNELPGGLNPLLMSTGFLPLSRPSYNNQDFTNETFGARFAVTPASWWRHQLTLGVDRSAVANVQTRRRLTTPADTLFELFTLSQRKLSAFYNSSITGGLGSGAAGTVTFGVDHYQTDANFFGTVQAVNTTGTIITDPPGSLTESRTTIRNTGYFLQGEMSWRETVYLTGGLRAESNSTFGRDLATPVLPRIGLAVVQDISRATLKLRTAYGRAIRAPAAGQAFGGASSEQVTLANPTLGPEKQSGWDAGLDLEFGEKLALSVSGFDQEAVDLIAFVQLPTTGVPTAQFQNIGRVSNRGIEVEGLLRFATVALKAQYAYTKSRIEELGQEVSEGADVQVGERPLGLPAHTAGAMVSVEPMAGTSLTTGLTYVGSFRQLDFLALFRCLGATGPCPESFLTTFSTREFVVTYPGFLKLNMGITQQITSQVNVFGSVENLTNSTAYEGSNNVATMGRITMVGAGISF